MRPLGLNDVAGRAACLPASTPSALHSGVRRRLYQDSRVCPPAVHLFALHMLEPGQSRLFLQSRATHTPPVQAWLIGHAASALHVAGRMGPWQVVFWSLIHAARA